MQRRTLLQAAGAAAATLAAPRLLAQEWPNAPVRIVVGFPPGGGTDALARVVAAKLTQMWNQQVIVETKAGVAGVLAADYVAQQPSDGSDAADGAHQQPRARAEPAAEAALQRRARLRADRAGRRHAQPADRQPGAAGEDRAGHRRAAARPSRARSASARPARARRSTWRSRCSSCRPGRRAARAVQGQRPAAHRPDRRPDHVQLRDHDRGDAAREERQGHRDRADAHAARQGPPERADDAGAGLPRLRGDDLVRAGRPRQAADADRREDQPDVNTVLAMPDVQEKLDTYGAEDGGGSTREVRAVHRTPRSPSGPRSSRTATSRSTAEGYPHGFLPRRSGRSRRHEPAALHQREPRRHPVRVGARVRLDAARRRRAGGAPGPLRQGAAGGRRGDEADQGRRSAARSRRPRRSSAGRAAMRRRAAFARQPARRRLRLAARVGGPPVAPEAPVAERRRPRRPRPLQRGDGPQPGRAGGDVLAVRVAAALALSRRPQPRAAHVRGVDPDVGAGADASQHAGIARGEGGAAHPAGAASSCARASTRSPTSPRCRLGDHLEIDRVRRRPGRALQAGARRVRAHRPRAQGPPHVRRRPERRLGHDADPRGGRRPARPTRRASHRAARS